MTSENSKNNLNVLFKKALAIEAHHPEEAIKYYDSIIDENESFKNIQKITINACHNKGVLLEKLGKHEESVECFEKIIQNDPDNLKAWYNKGVSLISQVNPYPSNPTLEDKSTLDASIKCMERAIEIDPNYAAAWYNKGMSCIVAGRSEESVICLDKALEIDPDFLGKVKPSEV